MAAGLGFKTFTTGEVLTAADVNGYLMQGVLVFASEAARNAAITSPQEGQFAYTKDNNSLWYYTGSAWAASGATGDIEGVTAGTGLTGGGTSGTVTLNFDVANYGGGSYAAGKNKIINGDFNINQRAFTSTTTSGTYGFDRWVMKKGGTDGTCTYTPQTFTAGSAPVTGYESTNFARLVTASGTATNVFAFLAQNIEDVRTFANQTITVSFWAKAASGTPQIAVDIEQYFGSGGSTQVNTPAGAVTISTSWARYSVTVAVPTISGTTIGAGNYTGVLLWVSAGSNFNTRASSIGIQNGTFDIWGVQAEAGSVATAFQTATGTLAGELAACQRYYWRAGGDNVYQYFGNGSGDSATNGTYLVVNPVDMRIAPTSIDYSTLAVTDGTNTNAVTNLQFGRASKRTNLLNATTAAGQVQYRPGFLITNNSTAGYLGFSAEL